MTNYSFLVAGLLLGCGGRVFDESGNGQLSGMESDASNADTAIAVDTGVTTDSAPPTVVDAGPTALSIAPSEIWYVEVHETLPSVDRTIRVNSKCVVTDNTGLDKIGDAARCKELFDIAGSPVTLGCGPGGGSGTVTMRLHDGREFVRDLAADRCSVLLPSVPTHKYVYAAWYSAGGK